jgi:hypothetical protein
LKSIFQELVKKKKDSILVEPDGVIFAVENRPLTTEEKVLLRQYLEEDKRKFHAKLKAGKVKIPDYLKSKLKAKK